MEVQLIKKLGLQNHKNLLEKTTELLRLLEIKSSAVTAGINDYAKISICIELAATLLGIDIDLIDVIKLSGLKKTAYEKCKRTFQKVLDLNKPPGINEICVSLNCSEIARKANDLLNLYKKQIENKNDNDIDLSHPQYSAMAVFQACKSSKTKILKSKILGFSYLKPSQWTKLEQQWDKLMGEFETELKNRKIQTKNKEENITKEVKEPLKVNKKLHDVTEEYEIWKARIIKKAREDLQKLQKNINESDLESINFSDSSDEDEF